MDMKDQLKKLFPDHEPTKPEQPEAKQDLWMQEAPISCIFEKRRGKPLTILEGYTGAEADFRKLAKELKTILGVGGSYKNDRIIIQGDYRDRIMQILKEKGFKTKRVGG